MSRRLTALLALALALGPAALAQDADREAQKATIDTVRSIGRGMFLYLAAQTVAGRAPVTQPVAEEAATADWSACPAVSHEEAAALLGPYLEPDPLPRVDGWGQPLELCIRRAGSGGPLLGVRSAGRDGRFQGPVYEVGKFDPADFDRDVVWMDGYFVTWPQRPGS